LVEPTGEIENRTEQVKLSVPASLSLYRDEDGDDENIHSEQEVFELAHEYLGKDGKGGAK
jgi:hypothetical protein